MGGSSSVQSSVKVLPPQPSSIFVDDKLRQGEAILRQNHLLRASFVKYIKDCIWTGFVDNAECGSDCWLDQTPSPSPSSSTWAKFGYKSPYSLRAARMSTIEEDLHLAETEEQPKDVNAATSLLFHRNGLRAVVIAMLLPHFLNCCGMGDADGNSLCEVQSDEPTVHIHHQMRAAQLKLKERGKRFASFNLGRLQEWLIDAVARFTKNELSEYLADMNASWIKDLLSAMERLPAAVMLGAVDAPNQHAKIVYSNCRKEGDLHQLYRVDCTPGGAVQVTSAMFGAKRYKRCLMSKDGTCRLRAFKPVFDTHNKHVYTLGLESKPFKDSLLQTQDTGNAQSEETFYQIEDLLLILPLLVRNFKCR